MGRPTVHRSVQLPGLEGKIHPPVSPSRRSRSPPSHTIIMDPNITPGSTHIATRLHHRLENSHCHCGETNRQLRGPAIN
ncbi:unnamed protein product, partial [Ectocarpus sp. 12 AP-2014]